MSAYDDAYAEVYDLIYHDKPYAAEAEFVAGQFRRNGVIEPARILDIACGTGRHAAELSSMGYEVSGVDSSAAMIAAAARRLPDMKLYVQDMRDLAVPGQPFDGALCLFDSIGWVTSDADIGSALSRIREHLRDDGILVLEYLHASAMRRRFEPVRTLEAEHAGMRIRRRSTTLLSDVRNVAHITHQLERFPLNGGVASQHMHCDVRFFLKDEMESFLLAAGFLPLRTFAGFSTVCELDDSVWHLVTIARSRG